MSKFDFNPFTGNFDKIVSTETDIADIVTTYLKLDCSNDPLTGNLDLGANDLDTTGTVQANRLEADTDALFGTTLGLQTGQITDSLGEISFGDENLITTGTLGAGAITATSYGGILEANLLDKAATETITGAYTFSGNDVTLTTSSLLLSTDNEFISVPYNASLNWQYGQFGAAVASVGIQIPVLASTAFYVFATGSATTGLVFDYNDSSVHLDRTGTNYHNWSLDGTDGGDFTHTSPGGNTLTFDATVPSLSIYDGTYTSIFTAQYGLRVATNRPAFVADIATNAGMFFIGGNSRFSLQNATSVEIFAAALNSDIVCGQQAAIATNATTGFLYVPSCAGTPTGTPAGWTGKVPIVVNTTNNKLYFYSGGSWRDAGP